MVPNTRRLYASHLETLAKAYRSPYPAYLVPQAISRVKPPELPLECFLITPTGEWTSVYHLPLLVRGKWTGQPKYKVSGKVQRELEGEDDVESDDESEESDRSEKAKGKPSSVAKTKPTSKSNTLFEKSGDKPLDRRGTDGDGAKMDEHGFYIFPAGRHKPRPGEPFLDTGFTWAKMAEAATKNNGTVYAFIASKGLDPTLFDYAHIKDETEALIGIAENRKKLQQQQDPKTRERSPADDDYRRKSSRYENHHVKPDLFTQSRPAETHSHQQFAFPTAAAAHQFPVMGDSYQTPVYPPTQAVFPQTSTGLGFVGSSRDYEGALAEAISRHTADLEQTDRDIAKANGELASLHAKRANLQLLVNSMSSQMAMMRQNASAGQSQFVHRHG